MPTPPCSALTRLHDESPFMVPNLDRGLSVLELLSEKTQGLLTSEMADTLEIPRNSMGRILATLMDRGFLSRDEKTKVYKLTRKLLSLGTCAVCDLDLIEESLDEMRRLRDATLETVLLSTVNGGRGVILEQIPARREVRLTVEPGSRFDLHCSAPGKLHLGYLPPEELSKVLATMELKRYTASTMVTKTELLAAVRDVQLQGYAVDRGEGFSAANCVSTPIFDRNAQCVAALTVTGIADHVYEARFPELAAIIQEHALRISRRLGYTQGGQTAQPASGA